MAVLPKPKPMSNEPSFEPIVQLAEASAAQRASDGRTWNDTVNIEANPVDEKRLII